ncbi:MULTISPECIES: hypothetical protein [unclassified Streptomyces]|uniref:hypothetical protein n=1 Tax=unclassified Streptomyces TaxID=2593676 RepID=UPI0033185A72
MNLLDRLQEAKEQGWLGEVAAIEASLAAAEQKLAAMRDLWAARTRASPPWDSLALTSRWRQATRYSACVQDSLRARSASRSAASRSAGAFIARARNARSAAVC